MTPNAEIVALREQVRVLCAGMKLRYENPAEVVPAEVVALVRAQERIAAIRALRRATGAGLVEAKRMIDALGPEEPPVRGGKTKSRSSL
jgi:ribosomal protein L7/L12